MMQEFRIVYFVVDPVYGTRVPIGAMVRCYRGVLFERAPHSSGLSAAHEMTLDMILRDLERASSFDAVPESVGSLVTMGDPIPAKDARDVAPWISEHSGGPMRDVYDLIDELGDTEDVSSINLARKIEDLSARLPRGGRGESLVDTAADLLRALYAFEDVLAEYDL